MKVRIDIPDADVERLDEIARNQALSRDALIRDAVAVFLERHRPTGGKDRPTSLDDGFGLWSDITGKTIDGLEYQERLRREW